MSISLFLAEVSCPLVPLLKRAEEGIGCQDCSQLLDQETEMQFTLSSNIFGCALENGRAGMMKDEKITPADNFFCTSSYTIKFTGFVWGVIMFHLFIHIFSDIYIYTLWLFNIAMENHHF
jgi:hypothetical protein